MKQERDSKKNSFKNLFILLLFVVSFFVGGVFGYALKAEFKNRIDIYSCTKDQICSIFYRETGSLNEVDYIIWLLALIDERKISAIIRKQEENLDKFLEDREKDLSISSRDLKQK